MRNIVWTTFCTLVLLASSCKQTKKEEVVPISVQKSQKETVMVPDSWIANRVAKAHSRLTGSESGKVIWDAMEAHGGLERWYKNGAVSFRFNYQPLDGGTPRDTYQVIDPWSSRARHYQVGDSTSQYGWDGKKAWTIAKDSTTFPYNTRFWSLTPYFFMAQPFVLDGTGVNLELLPQKRFKGRSYNVVKVSFDEGTGDAPDDYYVLYLDAETKQLRVIRYIVSYPGYFEKGKHLPEKLMELSGKQVVEGITFPANYRTYWLTEDETAGEHITNIKLSDVAFDPSLEADHFNIPEGATVLEGL
ncbi:DUF6503 family protein [Flagellimonas allohymeniacidonis]|uniref:Outer membrane lipoprotein-sorting protein n=1 Tax=Flagellimonas allohymeniacidonis TaxID=2517819 RepID=A0A4Q8QHU1_9FLAO|nr:DUF6503 family protein [Allomuricauda hymeniacidonis]TAI48019.1 hypothetical protein EW142_15325 [Allomuricauda hymeniacidonis]